MNYPRVILIGEMDEVPRVVIKINNTGIIVFSPLKKESWSYVASLYMNSVINQTGSEGPLEKKFKSLTMDTGTVSRENLMWETVKLAKKLNKQKIHLGNQFMRVMVTTGKTDPFINLDRLKSKRSISAMLNKKYDDILFVSNKNSFIKIVEGE